MRSSSVQPSSSTMIIPRRGALTMTSSSIGKAKRHGLRDRSNMRADILEDIKENHIPSPLKAAPLLPPIIWYDGGFWLLEIVGKAAEAKLSLPTNEKTKKLFRGTSTAWVGFSSSHGCLLFRDKTKKNHLFLLHPLLLSVFSVRIPPIKGVTNVLVLPDPIITRHTAMMMSSSLVALNSKWRLMFARCGGGGEFAELEGQDDRRHTQLSQTICINNCIYTITGSARDHYLEAWDCSNNICGGSDDDGGPRKVLDFKPTFAGRDAYHRSTLHLVESQGELWLVAIRRPMFGNPILQCSPDFPVCLVYRMDFKEKNWVRVDSLGDRVLIIIEYQTMCFSAKEFPQYERNSIYFKHHHIPGVRCRSYYLPRPVPTYHLVVFNMEDNSLKELKLKTTGEE